MMQLVPSNTIEKSAGKTQSSTARMRFDEHLDDDQIVQAARKPSLWACTGQKQVERRMSLHRDVCEHLECAVEQRVVHGAITGRDISMLMVYSVARHSMKEWTHMHGKVDDKEGGIIGDDARCDLSNDTEAVSNACWAAASYAHWLRYDYDPQSDAYPVRYQCRKRAEREGERRLGDGEALEILAASEDEHKDCKARRRKRWFEPPRTIPAQHKLARAVRHERRGLARARARLCTSGLWVGALVTQRFS